MTGTERGRFITLEGGEGAGKSTHARRLGQFLEEQGLSIVLTREPGGADGAEEIRRLLVEGNPGRWTPLSEALLHSAARADHIARVIEPALAAGRWVVCDRFTDSTIAYQGFGHGLGADAMARLNDLTTGPTRPELTLIMDIPVALGLERARNRGNGGGGNGARREDRYERMDEAFHERLREGFLAIARDEPERCVVIDTTPSEDEVAAAIRAAVAKRFSLS